MFSGLRGMYAVIVAVVFLGVACVVISVSRPASAQPPAEKQAPEPAPPEGQTYTGVKRCSSCHFKQYMSWKKTKHAQAFTGMAAKYQADPECLKCHVTAFAQAGGYAAGASPDLLQNLLGVTCEACHGPGSKHEEICKPLANVKQLSADQEKTARDSIWKVMPGNVCVRCHIEQEHKEHPKYDKQ